MSALNTVLLLIHLFIALGLVGVVLLQKSEGGALGIGGGGGGGFLTGRGQANLLTRITAGLAVCFFATSMLLTVVGKKATQKGSVFDRPGVTAPAGTAPATNGTPTPATPATPGEPTPAAPSGGILDKLK
ncbi:MAG: preprotein translocase subunit SecG [Hyphomicrobium sp.]